MRIISVWPKSPAYILLWTGLLTLAATTHAAAQVQILLSKATTPYYSVADAIVKNAPGLTTGIIEFPSTPTRLNPSAMLNIAIGYRAMQFAIKNMPGTALIVSLVPRHTVKTIQRKYKNTLISAIYPDQPLQRQLEFIQALMPGAHRMGILVGQHSFRHVDALRSLTRDTDLALQVGDARKGRLANIIKGLARSSDLILALPDSSLLTPSHAKWLLYMAYQRRVPVIGYSRQYTTAGALAAIFSTPEQIGRQVAGMIIKSEQQRDQASWQLPPPEYPDDFTIAINRNVAKSLGIELLETKVIRDQMPIIKNDISR